MTNIPQTAKEFARWLDQHRAGMSPSLLEKAERAYWSLQSIDQVSFGIRRSDPFFEFMSEIDAPVPDLLYRHTQRYKVIGAA